MHDVSSLT